jgi:hypothetical protein
MKHSLSVLVALSLLSGAVFAADTSPPPTHLQKGEWSYHSVVKITSGMMAGRTISKDWKVCVKDDRDAASSLMPHSGSGDTTCSKPELSYDKKGYHTSMSCVTKARGMTSKIHEDFLLSATDKGTAFTAHGKVKQQLMIASTPAREMDMTVDVTGKRTGMCKGE